MIQGAGPSFSVESEGVGSGRILIPIVDFLLNTGAVVEKDQLLVVLGSLEAMTEQDLHRCLAKSKLADPERAMWIINSNKLGQWLNSAGSSTLLINGNGEGNEIFSATTFIASKLLESLSTLQSVLSLSFFCSLHASTSDDFEANAIGMVKSLITQLLLHDFPTELNFLKK